jgi:hypothetical protein
MLTCGISIISMADIALSVPAKNLALSMTDVQLLQEKEEDDLTAGANPMAADSLMSGGSFKQLDGIIDVAHDRRDAVLIRDIQLEERNHTEIVDQHEDSVAAIVSHIDDAIQYHEAQEPREPKDEVEVKGGIG